MTRHEVGIDLIDVDRIVAVLGRYPDRFRHRILTPSEDRYCRGKPERIAGRWAAKEAVSKVLGLGVRGVGWREIEVLPSRAGQRGVIETPWTVSSNPRSLRATVVILDRQISASG